MATITRLFNLNLGTSYAGLTSTISYQVVVGGNVVVGPVTGTGITEGSFGAFTATGSYNVEIADFDTSWVGKIIWYESTNGILYEEPFTATQSGDSFPTVNGNLDASVSSRQASGIAVTLPGAAPNGWIDTPTFAEGATVPAVAAATVAGYATNQDPASILTDNTGFLSAVATSIWGVLTSALTTVNSVGQAFAAFLTALGADSKVQLSTGQAAAIAAAVLTDTAAENQSVAGSLGAVVKSSTGIFASGAVYDANPSTCSFVITLADGQALPNDSRYVGLGLWFTGSANLAPAKQTISGYQLLTSDTARVTFEKSFAGLPTNASTFEIG